MCFVPSFHLCWLLHVLPYTNIFFSSLTYTRLHMSLLTYHANRDAHALSRHDMKQHQKALTVLPWFPLPGLLFRLKEISQSNLYCIHYSSDFILSFGKINHCFYLLADVIIFYRILSCSGHWDIYRFKYCLQKQNKKKIEDLL